MELKRLPFERVQLVRCLIVQLRNCSIVQMNAKNQNLTHQPKKTDCPPLAGSTTDPVGASAAAVAGRERR